MESQTLKIAIREIDPRKLKLLDLNARFMRHETFMRLTENMRADGASTQTPFIWLRHDDTTQQPLASPDDDNAYEVLSGNHRVKAAIAADLPTIFVLHCDHYLTPERRKAIQLSHNAIAGEDDPAILKTVYESIQDVGMRMYTGLDDKILQLIEKVNVASIAEASLQFQTVSMSFLPHEVEAVNEVWEQVKKQVAGSKANWLMRWADYDKALDALEATSTAAGVKNTATAFMLILEIFSRHLDELRTLYLDADELPVQASRPVPIASVLEDTFVRADVAATLNKSLQKMISRNEAVSRGDALAKLAKLYLDHET